jgi:hypothetical protein
MEQDWKEAIVLGFFEGLKGQVEWYWFFYIDLAAALGFDGIHTRKKHVPANTTAAARQRFIRDWTRGRRTSSLGA